MVLSLLILLYYMFPVCVEYVLSSIYTLTTQMLQGDASVGQLPTPRGHVSGNNRCPMLVYACTCVFLVTAYAFIRHVGMYLATTGAMCSCMHVHKCLFTHTYLYMMCRVHMLMPAWTVSHACRDRVRSAMRPLHTCTYVCTSCAYVYYACTLTVESVCQTCHALTGSS